MSYDAIVKELGKDGEGVAGFDQSVNTTSFSSYGSISPARQLGEGICRGLVTEWLKCKKAGKAFVSTNPEALLEQHKTIAPSFDEQKSYDEAPDSMSDSVTFQSLAKSGLERTSGEAYESEHLGFAENGVAIATRVLTQASRYYILSLLGHSVGLFRPWALFGKSSTIHIFDPNVGEFKVTGEAGVRKALTALRTHEYPRSYLKGHKLHPFTG